MVACWKHTGILCLGFLFVFCEANEQIDEQYSVRTVAFYNVENLFDTVNDTLVYDDDRTPLGKDQWTIERYEKKITDISEVISGIGTELTGTSPDIIGLCEVENHNVLEDLINHPNLRNTNYGIIHFDSPDERGIDVALLYRRSVFLPVSFASQRLLLLDLNQERDYTRDQLVVSGILDEAAVHFIVNHWPSRSGGEARSKPYRIAAAQLNRQIMDSLYKIDPLSQIITMGDFNDDPTDDSLKRVLKSKGSKDNIQASELFNPMERLYKIGLGSIAYRDKWSLFDQILITGNLVDRNKAGHGFWKAGVYSPSFLITQTGRFKGYPYRTYAGGMYTGGYSDHLPVYIALVKRSN